MHRDHIQKLGAEAAREGLTLWDCPYLRAAEMPGHSGGSITDWQENVREWEVGWHREVQDRPPVGRGRVRRLVSADRSLPVVLRLG